MDGGLILVCVAVVVTGYLLGHKICSYMGWN